MPIFEIKKPIYTTLWVNCNSEEEAKDWANKIVATIEIDSFDETPSKLEFFEAESIQRNDEKINLQFMLLLLLLFFTLKTVIIST